MRCETLDRQLSAAFDVAALDDELQSHVAECLRCQAEVVRYRRLRTELAGLRAQPVPPVDGLLDDILGTLDASARARRMLRRGRQVACTVAAAGGAIGALVLLGRVRNRQITG